MSTVFFFMKLIYCQKKMSTRKNSVVGMFQHTRSGCIHILRMSSVGIFLRESPFIYLEVIYGYGSFIIN